MSIKKRFMRRIKSYTVEKLTYFSKYVKAYLKATKRLPEKYYIDAFAGTGKCILCDITQCKSEGGKKCLVELKKFVQYTLIFRRIYMRKFRENDKIKERFSQKIALCH